MEATTLAVRKRLEDEDHETYIENLKTEIERVEFNNIELVIKLREVARDLEIIWSRCRYARMGTSGIKTASGVLSAAGGACILMSTGPIMPLVVAGTGGLVLGSMGSFATAKLEQFLSSKKFEEVTDLMELNSRLTRQVRDDIERICSQDYQTLTALLRTADRLVQRDHALYPFFQMVRNVMNQVNVHPLAEVSSLFDYLVQIESIGTQVIGTTVPVEIAAVAGRETQDGAKKGGAAGFQKFGGVLLIFTGLISAYLSSHELIDVIKTKKSAAVQMLHEKASDIEAKMRPFDFLRD